MEQLQVTTSPARSKSLTMVVVALALAALILGMNEVARWTLIPASVDNEVVRTGHVSGTDQRLRWIELDDGRTLIVARSFISRSGGPQEMAGATMKTARWSSTAELDGSQVSLGVSSEPLRTGLGLLVIAALVLLRGTAAR